MSNGSALMPDSGRTETPPRGSIGLTRLVVGLVQGLTLYGLIELDGQRDWLPVAAWWWNLLFLVALYAPLAAVLGLGALTRRRLGLWIAVVIAVLAALSLLALPPGMVPDPTTSDNWLLFGTPVPLFIAQALVVASAVDGAVIARYPVYFAIAWKQALQLGLALLFLGLLWAILLLGAALFDLIHLPFWWQVIDQPWFYFPVSCVALVASIHLTDTAPGILAASRRLALTLLAGLLPILVVVVGGFLLALGLTSFTPLWESHLAARLLLLGAAGLIFLTNAAYQQGPPRPGEDGYRPPRLLAWSGSAAGPLTLVLVALAIYALAVRVLDYGWSPNRVLLAAAAGIAAGFALGYTLAGPWSGKPRRVLEATNLVNAFVTIFVLLALLSPLADPTRLAVASQVARLEGGLVTPQEFDFHALRDQGQHYGRAALLRLAENPESAIRDRAAVELRQYTVQAASEPPPTSDDIIANLIPHPAGHPIPAGLAALDQLKAVTSQPPGCLTTRRTRCEVVFLGSGSEGPELALLLYPAGERRPALLLQAAVTGRWTAVATVPTHCSGVRQSLLNGSFTLAPAVLPDIVLGGQRLVPSRPPFPGCPD